MLKPWVGQETGHGWGARVDAVPTLTYFILFYSTRWVPTKISKEFYALIFGGPDCPRNTLGPLTHQHSACTQVCENDRSDTIHLLLNCEISTRFVAVTVLSVCCTVIEGVMMIVVDNQDTSLLSWRWRQPVVSNIGIHWPDSSVICCCTVVILLCCILLLLLLCICFYIPIDCIFLLTCRLILWLDISLISPLSLASIVNFRVPVMKCMNSVIFLCPLTLCRLFQSLAMFLCIHSNTSCFYS